MTKQQDSKQLKEIKTLIESIEVYYYNDVTNEIMAKIKKLIKIQYGKYYKEIEEAIEEAFRCGLRMSLTGTLLIMDKAILDILHQRYKSKFSEKDNEGN